MTFDVIVIGGGAAGLSGAVALARARRSVLVLDGGDPRNAPAEGVHNLLGREGVAPAELLARGRDELRSYGGEVRTARVADAARDGDGFRVTLEDGEALTARRLLVATGLRDELPALPGLRERWGRDVLHCPYCHGWEVRDETIAVLGSGDHAILQAQLFRQLSSDVTLVLHEAPEPTAEEAAELEARGVRVVRGEVVALEAEGLRMRDGELVACDAVTVQPRFVARTDGLEGLGLTLAEHPMGRHIETDPTGLAAPGVWAAGNCADLQAVVGGAADGGVRAAGMLNFDLVREDGRLAVAATARAG